MQLGKRSIGGKLFMGFGAMLIVAVMLFSASLVAIWHEQDTADTYRKAIALAGLRSELGRAIMNNRLHLRNFLLNGDTREWDFLSKGMGYIEQLINRIEETTSNLPQNRERDKQLLVTVREVEKDWATSFATVLVDKRRQ